METNMPVSMEKIFSRAVIALAAIGLTFGAAPANADEAAEIFVQDILDEVEPILGETNDAVMFEGIAGFVDKYVDMRRVGLFTLGQYARRVTVEQRAAFLPLFKQYATQIYQDSLSNYSGETLTVTNSIDRSERDIIVNSEIVNAPPGSSFHDFNVHWRVYRNREGEMVVVDAGANDIWLAIEQRSQFTSVIANNGGGEQGMDALIAELREQVGE